MNIQTNVPLTGHSTLHIGGSADHFVEVHTAEELAEAVRFARTMSIPWQVMGSGSNILFADGGVRGLVIKNQIDGIAYEESAEGLALEAGAGVVFDTLVAEVAARGYWGLENLSAIPGTVGATPVQNVGAYGVEIATFIREVVVYDATHDTSLVLSKNACRFGYRHSLFKEAAGKNLIIVAVRFFLPRGLSAELSYRDLAHSFEGRGPETLTPQEVRDATIAIRSGKFPDYRVVGTAGSFFKNPIVPTAVFEELRLKYPAVIGHPHEGKIKVSLGWILDHVCSMRGVKEGRVGTYDKQALVLIAEKGATAAEVTAFAQHIAACVLEKTNITIEWEVTFKN